MLVSWPWMCRTCVCDTQLFARVWNLELEAIVYATPPRTLENPENSAMWSALTGTEEITYWSVCFLI